MARGDKPYLRKSADRKAQIRKTYFSSADWFVLCDLQIFSGKVYHRDPEQPHAQSLFLFPIVFGIKAGPPPPLEAILVIFGRRALIFFVWKLLKKNEKWHHFCAHAQWWSPWRRKNVEKGHLAPSNLTFLLIVMDTNGFRRMKEEGLIYQTLPQIF